MDIIFATNNLHKLREAQEILGEGFRILTPRMLGIEEEIPEDAPTLEGNAFIKSKFIWDKVHLPCFADDTGLEVKSLNGAPGVFSARYAGTEQNSKNNVIKLLKELQGVKVRDARFRTSVALILDGKTYTFEGLLNGKISLAPSGYEGFGYDPVFIPEGYNCSLAELSPGEKNRISHRADALNKLMLFITSITS
ncbi:MAG: RdgB/HAM1 family non-canonical purine NTP pyrophosphatase [Bacteroidales bacterium]|nr:RdgB/HAM1 family non-canonical purine NTP pyrophosphatase [Bacteroidales bacterium]MDD2425736.1 RdgB/HAM1 family non-canonical purine NTP pyrophosphatase [Bacteroidales bacterium]MDD3989620.1 RdgB/HAM1 family non-canonical purine NTP pyrophosphatase [Bacteroidales bacterium]MDD4639080.1 RdgB/HAM1 family non-canonical purine NTP pyrophosphatase [Bacteroidales bacterium]